MITTAALYLRHVCCRIHLGVVGEIQRRFAKGPSDPEWREGARKRERRAVILSKHEREAYFCGVALYAPHSHRPSCPSQRTPPRSGPGRLALEREGFPSCHSQGTRPEPATRAARGHYLQSADTRGSRLLTRAHVRLTTAKACTRADHDC